MCVRFAVVDVLAEEIDVQLAVHCRLVGGRRRVHMHPHHVSRNSLQTTPIISLFMIFNKMMMTIIMKMDMILIPAMMVGCYQTTITSTPTDLIALLIVFVFDNENQIKTRQNCRLKLHVLSMATTIQKV